MVSKREKHFFRPFFFISNLSKRLSRMTKYESWVDKKTGKQKLQELLLYLFIDSSLLFRRLKQIQRDRWPVLHLAENRPPLLLCILKRLNAILFFSFMFPFLPSYFFISSSFLPILRLVLAFFRRLMLFILKFCFNFVVLPEWPTSLAFRSGIKRVCLLVHLLPKASEVFVLSLWSLTGNVVAKLLCLYQKK